MNINKKIDRREFIKDVSLAGLGITVGASLIGANILTSSAQNTSRLVIASHSDAVTGVKINPDIAKKIVDAGIMQYTGQKTIADAWRSIFPSLLPNDLVTIKVNCINPSLSSHPQVIDAITSGLIAAGIKDNNIIIWDRTNSELLRSGFRYNAGDTGIRCFGTDEKGWGYNKQVKLVNQNVRLSKILTNTNHLINVPLLKDHGTAGITASMKNHYGSVDNPGNLHGGQCSPYVAELNNIPEIRDKTRLIVLDGFLGIYAGGPMGSPQFVYNSIIMGQDPVAMDYQCWKILLSERQKHGMNLPLPIHIDTARKMGFGTDDLESINVEMIDVKRQSAIYPEGKLYSTRGSQKL
jgi:uncharacterized protein (DUF362 family)